MNDEHPSDPARLEEPDQPDDLAGESDDGNEDESEQWQMES